MNESYIKLLAICSDSLGYIVDEQNTNDKDEVVNFIKLYNRCQGIKIFIFQMYSYNISTFCEIKKYIHTITTFDYIRKLIEESANIVVIACTKKNNTDFIHDFMK